MKHNMTKEEKLVILSNVSTGIDGIEEKLRHNIGDEDTTFFIEPIRNLLYTMEECLKS